MKTEERKEARKLREQGKSINEIVRLVGCGKGSVSRWVRDIVLSNEQLSQLMEKSGNGPILGGIKLKKIAEERHLGDRVLGAEKAKKFINDPLFVAGCMLYWAEGTKSANPAFSNSDPEAHKLFISFIKKFWGVKNEDFVIFCRYYTDLANSEEIESFWLKVLELPQSCLRRSCVNYYPFGERSSSMVKKRKSGSLKFGTCRLVVFNRKIFDELMGAIDFVKENLIKCHCKS